MPSKVSKKKLFEKYRGLVCERIKEVGIPPALFREAMVEGSKALMDFASKWRGGGRFKGVASYAIFWHLVEWFNQTGTSQKNKTPDPGDYLDRNCAKMERWLVQIMAIPYLDLLPRAEEEIIRRVYCYEETPEAISKEIGITPATVKKVQASSLALLREILSAGANAHK